MNNAVGANGQGRTMQGNTLRTLQNCEPVLEFQKLNSGVSIDVRVINPGNSALFPWLSVVSQGYKKYKFNYLSFQYKPIVPVTLGGQVVLYYSGDDKQLPSNMLQAKVYPHVQQPVYKQININIPKNVLNRERQYYVRLGNDQSDENIDPRLHDIGIFGALYESSQTPITLGTLYVTYSITFYEPIPHLASLSIMDRPGITKAINEIEQEKPHVSFSSLAELVDSGIAGWRNVTYDDNGTVNTTDQPFVVSLLPGNNNRITFTQPFSGRVQIDNILKNGSFVFNPFADLNVSWLAPGLKGKIFPDNLYITDGLGPSPINYLHSQFWGEFEAGDYINFQLLTSGWTFYNLISSLSRGDFVAAIRLIATKYN